MKIKKHSCFFWGKHRKNNRLLNVEDIPDCCERGTIYIVGNSSSPQYAIFKCPCGCGRNVELNLNAKSKPCWKVSYHWFGTISFSPSIWRNDGCRSHFFYKKGEVKWCK